MRGVTVCVMHVVDVAFVLRCFVTAVGAVRVFRVAGVLYVERGRVAFVPVRLMLVMRVPFVDVVLVPRMLDSRMATVRSV